ncbi:MAG: DUF2892 domain-containing protein [Hyphomonadaceae bacterium]
MISSQTLAAVRAQIDANTSRTAGIMEAEMKANEGAIDRVLRVLVGAGVLSLAFIGPQTPWAYLGVIPLLTGLVGFCPLYAILGINTCGVRKA